MELNELVPWIPLLIALLTAIFGPSLARYFSKQKDKADTADTLTGTAVKLLDQLQEERDKIQSAVSRAQARIILANVLLGRAAILLAQIDTEEARALQREIVAFIQNGKGAAGIND